MLQSHVNMFIYRGETLKINDISKQRVYFSRRHVILTRAHDSSRTRCESSLKVTVQNAFHCRKMSLKPCRSWTKDNTQDLQGSGLTERIGQEVEKARSNPDPTRHMIMSCNWNTNNVNIQLSLTAICNKNFFNFLRNEMTKMSGKQQRWFCFCESG